MAHGMELADRMLAVTLVLARVLAETNAPAPALLSDEAILVLKRQDIRVGNGCTGSDAGVDGPGTSDGGVDGNGLVDAGLDAPTDALGDAGMPDGGDAPVGDPCEHIPGDAITLVMQPHFSQLTTGARFAILVVTPSRPIVETTGHDVFDSLASTTAPVVHEIEKEVEDPAMGRVCGQYTGAGCGGGPSFPDDPWWEPPPIGDGGLGDSDGGYSVDRIGPYQVVRASPTTTAELTTWLSNLNYLVMPDDVAAVAPYIAKGYTVVALRVALEDTPDGALAPIALTWAGSEIRLPAALGSTSSAFPTTVYIAADHRYDLPGATVPFAFHVGYSETRFLTRNEYTFDPTTADEDPVAIQVMNDPEKREIIENVVEVRVPVRDDAECGCEGGSGDIGCGCRECNAQGNPRPDWAILLGTIVFTLVPRRRRRR